jgi:hypothetical protein
MRSLMGGYEKSGLGPTKFAAREGISLNQLKYWVKKLKKEKASKPGFIQLTPSPSSSVSPFVEVYYPNGVKIKVPTGDLSFLSQLIRVY